MRGVGAPRVHLFVCTNQRQDSPLGPGCGARGEALYASLKDEVSRRRLVVDVWVTKTHCLGICPAAGATMACYPARAIVTEVDVADAPHVLETALDSALDGALDGATSGSDSSNLEEDLRSLERLQTDKVLALARRLKPGLTLEDVQNPHDFPELDDPDWHYEDGILTGLQSAIACTRRSARERS